MQVGQVSSVCRAFALAIACLVLLVGCARGRDDERLPIAAWTLVVGDAPGVPITLPVHLGPALGTATKYVLSANVTLPAAMQGRELTLAIPFLLTTVTVTVDDRPLVSLDPEQDLAYRGEGSARRWRVPADAARPRILLRMTLSHGWTQSAWVDTIPRLSATPGGDAEFLFIRDFNRITAVVGFSTAIFAGYLYLVVFLSDRRRAAYGWFALTGIACTAYPSHALGFAQRWLGGAEACTVATGVGLAVVAGVRFTQTYFELEKPLIWPWLAAIGGLIFAGFLIHGPFDTTPLLGPPAILILVAAVIYQTSVLVRFARKRPLPRHALMLLLPWLAFALIALPDLVAWLGLGEMLGGLRTACLGMSVIALFQTAALSREHIMSLRRSDELSREREDRIRLLEAHGHQVDLLNEELRHQVAARSAQLAETLAKIGTSNAPRELDVDDVVDDRYRIVRRIGSGGAGTVYQVVRLTDDRPFALKVIQGPASSIGLARLAREAQLAAQIHHENVISIVDVDVAAAGYLFVVMEYVDGPSLRDQRGRFGEVAWALPILEQIAAGLAAIHEHGVVHRDLKPANLLVIPEDGAHALRIKIADFGIASWAPSITDPAPIELDEAPTTTDAASEAETMDAKPDAALTRTGALLGTPLYMAPELAFGAKYAAAAVDVFSFGVIAFELLSGKRPFAESPALRIFDGREATKAASLATCTRGLEERTIELIDRCLSFAPERRPTAAEVHALLRETSSRDVTGA